MKRERTIATSVGVLYIIGTVAGILSVVVSAGLFDGADYDESAVEATATQPRVTANVAPLRS